MNFFKLFIHFVIVLIVTAVYTHTADAAQKLQIDRNSIVARVDKGSITLDQLLEIWGPSYYEILNNARNGKIAPVDINKYLQKEWTKSLDVVIRDEAFYQEALNNYESNFQEMVDQYYAAQRSSGMTRKRVEERLRKMMKKSQEENIQRVIKYQIKAAGGLNNLNNVLRARDITFEQWRERLVRKSFTYGYLFSVFEPLGTAIEPRPQQILHYYKKNIQDFTLPDRVIFDHILISNEKRGSVEKADNIAQQIGSGILDKKISFSRAAVRFSDDKEGADNKGREINISPDPEREAWLADVREAVKEQKPGELEILESPMGFHITVLRKVIPGKKIPFKKAQKMIVQKIKDERWEKKSDKFYKKLKNNINIEVIQKTVPESLQWHSTLVQNKKRKIGMSAVPNVNSR